MPALTPTFLFDFESEMQRIQEMEYLRMSASENLWWQEITKVRPTGKKREIIAWLLSTAQIRDQGLGGNINFDDMAATFQEYDVKNAGEGLSLARDQVEDNDGNGFDFAMQWSSDVAAQGVYWPQKKVANLIFNGATSTALAYDNVQFFADNIVNSGNGHPVNQFRPSAGKYFNWMHGAASGIYPGALPIDESVPIDVALKNLQIAMAYIASIKMPNGVDPRFLKPRRLLHAPRLASRAQQLTNSKYIAQAAATGGGSADIEPIIRKCGFAQPIEAQEFANSGTSPLADGANSDLVWYLLCEQVTSTQLGGFVYVDREPFSITYYTGAGGGTGVDAVLDRQRRLEWHTKGRNVAGYGHPYTIFRFDPS